MDYERFLTAVGAAGGLDRDGAERATAATLATLAERISPEKSGDLLAALPPELGSALRTESPAERFDVDEFLRRVAGREQGDPVMAERDAGAVFEALSQALPEPEYAGLVRHLTRDFAYLQPGRPEIVPEVEFVTKVAGLAGLDADAGRRAVDAVLETLAERVAAGEVNDLVGRLPAALHEPLRRGRSHNPGPGRRMSPEEFVIRVAERDGVPLEQALTHTRAVCVVLRESVREEFFDASMRLPADHAVLWQSP